MIDENVKLIYCFIIMLKTIRNPKLCGPKFRQIVSAAQYEERELVFFTKMPQ